jgi:ADP-ribosylglycohydrolase
MTDMGRRFCRWLFEGYWTANGVVFQVDPETRQAIMRIHQGANLMEAGSPGKVGSGNGSLVRILPMAFVLKEVPVEDRFPIIHQIAALTHAHPRSHIACAIYVEFARNLLMGLTPQEAYQQMREVILFYYTSPQYKDELPHFRRILRENISSFHESMIRSDSYVVHTLEASLWCFFHCPSYVETVLKAVNLGCDTDTTAAVAGGLAGIHHGLEAIPREWVDAVARKDDILALGRRLESRLVLD